jgi:hypothetical protein
VSRLYLIPIGKAGNEGHICRPDVGGRCISGEEMACCSRVKDGPSFDGGGIGCYCSEEDGGSECIIIGGGRAMSGIN